MSTAFGNANKISIHAPSRERQSEDNSTTFVAEFQSTLPRGSDSTTPSHTPSIPLFQSTLPRGSDVSCGDSAFRSINFNPRSLAGATSSAAGDYSAVVYFNPRSLAGATTYRTTLPATWIFQSTLPRGSD